MGAMSPPARKPGMTLAEFDTLVKASKLSRSELAEVLGVDRRTVIRWAMGDTPISIRTAVFIRSVLKNYKPKK